MGPTSHCHEACVLFARPADDKSNSLPLAGLANGEEHGSAQSLTVCSLCVRGFKLEPRITHSFFDFFPFCVAKAALNGHKTNKMMRALLTSGLPAELYCYEFDVK